MVDRPGVPEITRAEHRGPASTGDNIDLKAVGDHVFDPVGLKWYRASPAAALVQANYDYVAITYNSTSDVYQFYSGGSGGILVGTVTLSYADSTKSQLNSVTRT